MALSGAQDRVLKAIETWIEEHNYPPTVRDLCQATGLTSPATVYHHLQALEGKGYIERDPSKSRTIVVKERDPDERPCVMDCGRTTTDVESRLCYTCAADAAEDRTGA